MPQVMPGAEPVFQRHSLAVSLRSCEATLTAMNERSVSSSDEYSPFMGESTLNTGRLMLQSTPFHI